MFVSKTQYNMYIRRIKKNPLLYILSTKQSIHKNHFLRGFGKTRFIFLISSFNFITKCNHVSKKKCTTLQKMLYYIESQISHLFLLSIIISNNQTINFIAMEIVIDIIYISSLAICYIKIYEGVLACVCSIRHRPNCKFFLAIYQFLFIRSIFL